MHAGAILYLSLVYDCGYAVGRTVATARPVIGNTLRITGSKGEACKGVTRHLERGRETGSVLRKEHSVTTRNENRTKASRSKISLVDASFKRIGAGTYTIISLVVVVRQFVAIEGCFERWAPWVLSLTCLCYTLGRAEF